MQVHEINVICPRCGKLFKPGQQVMLITKTVRDSITGKMSAVNTFEHAHVDCPTK